MFFLFIIVFTISHTGTPYTITQTAVMSQPMWSMITEENVKVLNAFRCLAQLAMAEC